ncbi:hypothetical protein [Haloarcula laminariae]|uniref:hypothetical protein n=1 Tax=Haloarcula laminariae TaxID=2961577 RepID=UPI0021C69DE3|nr:hypothetical protein [Halomicroarcula laminariae]
MPSVAALGTAVLVFGGPLAAGYWVFRDAAARGSDRAGPYGVAATLLPIPLVPLYLFVRRTWPERRHWSRRDRAAGTAAAALLSAWAVATLLAPPDPGSQFSWGAGAAVAVAAVAHPIAVRWVAVHGPTQ